MMIEDVLNSICGRNYCLSVIGCKSVCTSRSVSSNSGTSFCKATRIAAALLCLLVSYLDTSIAVAEEFAVVNSKGNLVLGVASIPEYIGSDDQQAVPLIISNFSFGNINGVFEGTGARFDLYTHPILEFGSVINLALPRDDLSSEAVTQVGDIGFAIELGAYLGFAMPFTSLPEGELSGYVSVRNSLIGPANGTQVLGVLEYFFAPLRFLRVGVNTSFTLTTRDYMQEYFGVNEAQSARSGLPVFRPDGGLRDITFTLYSVLSLSPSWGIFGIVQSSRLLDDAARSPIVSQEGSRDQLSTGIGLFLNFF